MSHKLLIGIFLICLLLDGVSSTLKKVWLITRHGDRSPTGNFPKLHQWEILGELTGEGMDQLYRLGGKIRKKYIEEIQFLPKNYSANSIYVRSTDKDRTLMSAQSFIYGLYPLGTGPDSSIFKLDGDIPRPYNFQPVPIHTEYSKTDLLLYAYKNCPPLLELLKERKQTTEWKAKESETEKFRAVMAEKIGASELPLSKIPGVYHSLKAEIVHKRQDLSEFGITEEDFQTVEKLKNWVLARKYYTRRTGQIGAGILLSHIIQNMEKSSEPSEKTSPRFIYYSGHDGTILSLFSAMGFLPGNIEVPHYSSYIIFELHEYNGASFVHMEFNGNPIPRYNNISLSEFKSEMKPGIFSEADYKSYCQEVPSYQNFQTIVYYFSYLFAFLLGYFLASKPIAINNIKSIKQL